MVVYYCFSSFQWSDFLPVWLCLTCPEKIPLFLNLLHPHLFVKAMSVSTFFCPLSLPTQRQTFQLSYPASRAVHPNVCLVVVQRIFCGSQTGIDRLQSNNNMCTLASVGCDQTTQNAPLLFADKHAIGNWCLHRMAYNPSRFNG